MKGFLKGFLAVIGTAILAPIVTGIALVIFTPQIADSFAYLNPSCDKTEGLSPIRLQQMYDDRKLIIDRSTVAKPPKGFSPNHWQEAKIIDGNAGTPWVPAEDDDKRRLTLTFTDGEQDVQLICIVNGQAATSWAYLRAERVRTAYVYTKKDSVVRANLRTLGPDDMQNRQQLKFAKGKTKTITVEISETYEGQTVYDPDVDRWLKRVERVAIGEIEVYTRDPKAQKRFFFF
jgi:hypothetical protein